MYTTQRKNVFTHKSTRIKLQKSEPNIDKILIESYKNWNRPQTKNRNDDIQTHTFEYTAKVLSQKYTKYMSKFVLLHEEYDHLLVFAIRVVVF